MELTKFQNRGMSAQHEVIQSLFNSKLKGPSTKEIEEYSQTFIMNSNKIESMTPIGVTHMMHQSINLSLYLVGFNGQHPQFVSRKRAELQAIGNKSELPLLSAVTADAIEEVRMLSNKNQATKPKEEKVAMAAKGKPPTKCHTCGASSHKQDRCYYNVPNLAPEGWKPAKQLGKFKNTDLSKGKPATKSKKGKGSDSDAATVMVSAGKAVTSIVRSTDDVWIADSGASDHMTNRYDLFIEGEVTEAAYSITQAKGQTHSTHIGNIRLPFVCHDGTIKQVVLKNVLYVPGLYHNLLSLHKLRGNGVEFNSGNDTIRRINNKEELGSCTYSKKHWFLNWKPQLVDTTRPSNLWNPANAYPSSVLPTIETNDDQEEELVPEEPMEGDGDVLMHTRFGHVSYSGIDRTLKDKNIIGVQGK